MGKRFGRNAKRKLKDQLECAEYRSSLLERRASNAEGSYEGLLKAIDDFDFTINTIFGKGSALKVNLDAIYDDMGLPDLCRIDSPIDYREVYKHSPNEPMSMTQVREERMYYLSLAIEDDRLSELSTFLKMEIKSKYGYGRKEKACFVLSENYLKSMKGHPGSINKLSKEIARRLTDLVSGN